MLSDPVDPVKPSKLVYTKCSRCNMITEHIPEDHTERLAELMEIVGPCRVRPKYHLICDCCDFCDDCEQF